jgi:hypothetical protein
MSGPRAFPCGDQQGTEPDYGMDLRDWFAGQALIGIMSTAGAFQRADRRHDMVAEQAYLFAKAMMAERERR